MKLDFDYQSVPHNFNHCLNEQCLRADTCLRRLVGAHVPPECHEFRVISPFAFRPDGEDCPYFMTNKKVIYGQGMVRLLDNLPHHSAVTVKYKLQRYFGRTQYYRVRKGGVLITPVEQAYIKQLFRQEGVDDDPVFDHYVESYKWLND